MGFSINIDERAKAEIDEAVREAAAILGLEPYLDRYPRQLSGGQRQRVAMGRAIVRDPEAFLFDEPLSNLDAKLRVQMRAEIKALHQRLGTTTIYVTHDQIEAMTMADRIVVLNGGRVEQVGPPLELYDNPRNRFVAGFLGSPSINFLDAMVDRRDGVPAARFDNGDVLPVPAWVPDGPLTVGIRPEHLSLSETDSGLRCEIATVEPTGAETLVFANHADQPVTFSLRGRLPHGPGDTLNLTPDPDKVLFFERDGGERILPAHSEAA